MTTSSPWDAVLGSLSSGMEGPFFFLKAGKTKLRLLLEEGKQPQEFFTEVTNRYGKTKYAVFANVLDAEGRDIANTTDVKVVILTKTVMQDIITACAEGWELFDEEEGHGISITRTGESLNTKYSVVMSPKALKVDHSALEWPEKSLEELGMQFTASSEENGNQKTESNESDW